MLKILMVMVSCFFILTSCNNGGQQKSSIDLENQDEKQAEKFINDSVEDKNNEQKTEDEKTIDASNYEKYQISTLAFDTIIDIVIYSDDEEYANSILKEAEELCFYYDDLLNKTKEYSLISKLNESKEYVITKEENVATLAGDKKYSLKKEDEILLKVIKESLEYSGITNGYFDITIEPLVSLWGIGNGNTSVPSDANIKEAMSKVNYKNVKVVEGVSSDTNDIIITLGEDTTIDVGGIAKGFIADEVKQFLLDNGVYYGLLNFGGNVLTIGNKPSGDSYVIGIRDPHEGTTDLVGTVKVEDKSVVTSGVYERYFEKDGIIYHHIIDPKTGYPSNNNLLAVTIVSDESIDGDAFSTSIFLLGLEEGLNLVNSIDEIEAMFITVDSEFFFSENFQSKYKFGLME